VATVVFETFVAWVVAVVPLANAVLYDHVPLETWAIPVEAAELPPVPPYPAATAVPCHTPVAMVPTEVRDERVATEVVAIVPDAGKVRDVAPPSVRVSPKLPEKVMVLAALLATPAPPYAGPITPAFHVPDVRVPTVAIDEEPATGEYAVDVKALVPRVPPTVTSPAPFPIITWPDVKFPRVWVTVPPPVIADQEAAVPLVVRKLPLCPV
jgi:hypothetical protein